MFDDFEITIVATEPSVTEANVTVRYAGGVRVAFCGSTPSPLVRC